MRAAIIGSGIVDNYIAFADKIGKCDIVICADGGINHLVKADISPDVFIGDFDSCDEAKVKNLAIMTDTKIITHNPVKNDTDMQLCIDYALENSCDEIILFAALGGRVDHELSNIFHLKYILEKGGCGEIYSYNNRLMITDNYLKVDGVNGYKLSIIPVTDKATGVTLKGLKYPLDNAEIIQGTSLGVSNEFNAEHAEIFVKEGILLVIVSKD